MPFSASSCSNFSLISLFAFDFAKVTKEEMDGVVHYMIDEVTPDVPFSVSEFQMRSEKYIEEINKKGKSILITGGTGLYLNSLIYNMDFALNLQILSLHLMI